MHKNKGLQNILHNIREFGLLSHGLNQFWSILRTLVTCLAIGSFGISLHAGDTATNSTSTPTPVIPLKQESIATIMNFPAGEFQKLMKAYNSGKWNLANSIINNYINKNQYSDIYNSDYSVLLIPINNKKKPVRALFPSHNIKVDPYSSRIFGPNIYDIQIVPKTYNDAENTFKNILKDYNDAKKDYENAQNEEDRAIAAARASNTAETLKVVADKKAASSALRDKVEAARSKLGPAKEEEETKKANLQTTYFATLGPDPILLSFASAVQTGMGGLKLFSYLKEDMDVEPTQTTEQEKQYVINIYKIHLKNQNSTPNDNKLENNANGINQNDVINITKGTIQITDNFDARDDQSKTASISSNYTLRPLEWISFGLATGVLVTNPSFNRPVTTPTDPTKPLVAASTTGLMTMVNFNFHPSSFNDSLVVPSWDEKFKFVCSLIMTPNAGVGLGASYDLFRGVGVSTGYGLIYTSELRSGDAFGAPSNNPTNPIKRGFYGAWFIGVTYNLK